MTFYRHPNWINPNLGTGGHIRLKGGEQIHIGGVLASVILAIVGIGFA